MRSGAENLLLVDAGDAIFPGKSAPEARARAIFSAMKLMHYDVLNVADGELAEGREFFRAALAGGGIPLVSANLSGLAGVEPYIVKDMAGVRVGITGISAKVFFKEERLAEEGLQVKSYVTALKEVLPELREKADIVVLLSHLGYEGTVNMLRFNGIDGIDVAIAGHGRKMLKNPQPVNGTIVIQNSMDGEFLGALRLEVEAGLIMDYTNEFIALTDEVEENEKALAIMQTFKEADIELRKALKEEKKKREMEEAQSEILKMSPQEFLEMMKKENAKSMNSLEPAVVPMEKE